MISRSDKGMPLFSSFSSSVRSLGRGNFDWRRFVSDSSQAFAISSAVRWSMS